MNCPLGLGRIDNAFRAAEDEWARFGRKIDGREEKMRNEFTAVIERDGEWYIGYCPEIPGANGQGRTVEECRASLGEAIALILKDRREDALRGVPPDAIRDIVVVA